MTKDEELVQAIKNNNIDEVKKLLNYEEIKKLREEGKKYEEKTLFNYNKEIDELFEQGKQYEEMEELVEKRNQYRKALLLNRNKIEKLRREGANPNYYDEDDFTSHTPIKVAAENGNAEIFKIILEALNNNLPNSDIEDITLKANDEIKEILHELKESYFEIKVEEQHKLMKEESKNKQKDEELTSKLERYEELKNNPNMKVSADRMKEAREALLKVGRFTNPVNRVGDEERIPSDRMKEAQEALQDPVATPQASQSFTQKQKTARETQHEQHANPNILTPPPMPGFVPPPMSFG